ncbi:MAG TPA: hypothetical protein VK457_17070 [Chloroflexota bacterium]|nr:hypothetical protein [Chloroflexota bacterium]
MAKRASKSWSVILAGSFTITDRKLRIDSREPSKRGRGEALP